jgi:NAD(P)-dependent dehydrogenase (short-subunit alcohol dehydrogenase family)
MTLVGVIGRTLSSHSEASPQQLFDIEGRSALIVGATGALGAAVARAFAAGGARLTVTAGTQTSLDALVADLPRSTRALAARPHTDGDARTIVEGAVEAHGSLDIVVHAAGINHVAPIHRQPVEDWDAVLEANLRGAWLLCRAAGAHMVEQGTGGKVILVSSVRGKLGHAAGYSAYCSSKAAIDGLCRALALEWGAHGITVNALAPTVFRSPLTAWMYEDTPKASNARADILARIPLGRLAEPEDVVGAALFLASRASDFCTGQVLYVDGGYSAG